MIYLDSCAIVKLVHRDEANSGAINDYVRKNSALEFVSSALTLVEVRRALIRTDAHPKIRGQAEKLLANVALITITTGVLERASRYNDTALRSLDAIQLATAEIVREHLTSLVTYDQRLMAAALASSLPVIQPIDTIAE